MRVDVSHNPVFVIPAMHQWTTCLRGSMNLVFSTRFEKGSPVHPRRLTTGVGYSQTADQTCCHECRPERTQGIGSAASRGKRVILELESYVHMHENRRILLGKSYLENAAFLGCDLGCMLSYSYNGALEQVCNRNLVISRSCPSECKEAWHTGMS
jgi:hypothetical protein